MNQNVTIKIIEGDALSINADVLALKYAQQYYGVDELVAERLAHAGVDQTRMQPRTGNSAVYHFRCEVLRKGVSHIVR